MNIDEKEYPSQEYFPANAYDRFLRLGVATRGEDRRDEVEALKLAVLQTGK